VSGPQVLLVTSAGSSPAVVTPMLAALEVTEMRVRAIDVGRAGSRSQGAVERMMRALTGELSERRLMKELESNPPDVIVAFDPGAAQALTVARDGANKPVPVVAVIDELTPVRDWSATDVDRFLVVDDEAAVALADHGIEGERIMTMGPFCPHPYAVAGRQSRASLRARFKLPDVPVIVVEVAGLGYEETSQIALQLSLTESNPVYLFDAGNDNEAATALRRQVPTLGMKAKLFRRSQEAALYWRAADVVVARPSARAVARALVVGARFVSFMPDDAGAIGRAKALEQRHIGVQAQNALLISSALETVLRVGARSDSLIGIDGVAHAADVVAIVGEDKHAVMDERLAAARAETSARVSAAAAAAAAAARATAPAGELEDLGGFSGGRPAPSPPQGIPDLGDFARLRAELDTRMKQVSRTMFASREAAEKWDQRRLKADEKGDPELSRRASERAEVERERMHAALRDMGEIQSELKQLEQAELNAKLAAASAPKVDPDWKPSPPPRKGPSIDDELRRIKRGGGTTTATGKASSSKRKKRKKKSGVDDELAALKRKMSQEKKR